MKTLKNTRTRGLPPKAKAADIHNHSGSFPTIARTSVDHRTGKPAYFWVDDNVLQASSSRNYPSLLANTSRFLTSELSTSFPSVRQLSPFVANSILDSVIFTTTSLDVVEPFKDTSLTIMSKSSSFFLTGSSVTDAGEGFSQPVWSKTKIEIPLECAKDTTIEHWVDNPTSSLSHTGSNYPVCFWNSVRKLWEGIGTGTKYASDFKDAFQGMRRFFEEQPVAFSAGVADNAFAFVLGEKFGPDIAQTLARPENTFGFPYHPKFQPTSSQTIPMSTYISEPFLLEKIVVELDVDLKTSGINSNPSQDDALAMWSIFLLNCGLRTIPGQTSPTRTTAYMTGSTVTSYTTSSVITSGSYSDLIDYATITAVKSGTYFTPEGWRREYVIPTGSLEFEKYDVAQTYADMKFSGHLAISSSVKANLSYETPYSVVFRGDASDTYAYSEYWSDSGRNQLFMGNGRDWHNSFQKPVLNSGNVVDVFGNAFSLSTPFFKANGYVLLPTDNIAIGWQNPGTKIAAGACGPGGLLDIQNWFYSITTFKASKTNKIILYGSSLRLDPDTGQLSEHHDTLNQLLTSNAVHEVVKAES